MDVPAVRLRAQERPSSHRGNHAGRRNTSPPPPSIAVPGSTQSRHGSSRISANAVDVGPLDHAGTMAGPYPTGGSVLEQLPHPPARVVVKRPVDAALGGARVVVGGPVRDRWVRVVPEVRTFDRRRAGSDSADQRRAVPLPVWVQDPTTWPPIDVDRRHGRPHDSMCHLDEGRGRDGQLAHRRIIARPCHTATARAGSRWHQTRTPNIGPWPRDDARTKSARRRRAHSAVEPAAPTRLDQLVGGIIEQRVRDEVVRRSSPAARITDRARTHYRVRQDGGQRYRCARGLNRVGPSGPWAQAEAGRRRSCRRAVSSACCVRLGTQWVWW